MKGIQNTFFYLCLQALLQNQPVYPELFAVLVRQFFRAGYPVGFVIDNDRSIFFPKNAVRYALHGNPVLSGVFVAHQTSIYLPKKAQFPF